MDVYFNEYDDIYIYGYQENPTIGNQENSKKEVYNLVNVNVFVIADFPTSIPMNLVEVSHRSYRSPCVTPSRVVTFAGYVEPLMGPPQDRMRGLCGW